jgi:hypothetical protein
VSYFQEFEIERQKHRELVPAVRDRETKTPWVSSSSSRQRDKNRELFPGVRDRARDTPKLVPGVRDRETETPWVSSSSSRQRDKNRELVPGARDAAEEVVQCTVNCGMAVVPETGIVTEYYRR